MDEPTKKCKVCKEVKLLSKFTKCPAARDGRARVCTKCRAILDSKTPNTIRTNAYVARAMYGINRKDY